MEPKPSIQQLASEAFTFALQREASRHQQTTHLRENLLTNPEARHMKPSNQFADITETQFSELEAKKALYRQELLSQIKDTKELNAKLKQSRIE